MGCAQSHYVPDSSFGMDHKQLPYQQMSLPERAEVDTEMCKSNSGSAQPEMKTDERVAPKRKPRRRKVVAEREREAPEQEAPEEEAPEDHKDNCEDSDAELVANDEMAPAQAPEVSSTSGGSWWPFSCGGSSGSKAVPASGGGGDTGGATGGASGGWLSGMASLTQATKEDPGVYRFRAQPLDTMKGAAWLGASNSVAITQDMEVFKAVTMMGIEQVADLLRANGCSDRIVQMFLDNGIDGDTLHHIRLEHLMRDFDLTRYQADGLYDKIRRVLGMTIGETLTTIRAIDAEPTQKQMLRIVEALYTPEYLEALRGKGKEGQTAVSPGAEGVTATAPAATPGAAAHASVDDMEEKTSGEVGGLEASS